MREINEEFYMTAQQYESNVRDIFKPSIQEFKESISDDESIIKIGFITDTHYVIRDNGYFGGKDKIPGMAVRNRSHLYNVGYVSDKLDFVVHGGDVVDGNERTSYVYNQLVRDMGTLFSTMSCSHGMVIGNHDNNTNVSTVSAGKYRLKGWDFTVDPKLLNSYFVSDSRINKEENVNYWYFDTKGIRIIGLDSFPQYHILDDEGYLKYPAFTNSIFDQKQLEWLIDKLATNKPIIMFTHCPIDGTLQTSPIQNPINHDMIKHIISAKQYGEKGSLVNHHPDFPIDVKFDFTNYTGNIISIVNGHTHYDCVKEWETINLFAGINSLGTGANQVTYWDTDEEDAFYVIEIDTKMKKVCIKGYGRASNHTFNFR